ncbi:MAG: tryptophan--tRNA ligase [Candidatus Neomarinimicrobiota bacterium]|nr:tryptophan--tRNA ligase [Candidatus Neomarinimicrobiota bacterium]|tara:strand:- start:444 stop:1427 length:984 start_codon:yes stop_codon:yes gene_type:complete
MAEKKNLRVLSGIQPSGVLHLGNYFGMMSRMIRYQDENELFCFIANYHALTTLPDPGTLSSNTFNAACDFLALGMDPEKSTFWVQSDVPQVTELTWILSSQAGVGLMDRATSYKDKIAQGLKPNMGLYSYPVLMAADILLFDSQIVPVGKDQKQHLEMTRDIAIRFNNTFGDTLVVPEPDIEEVTQLVPGIDGQKMSKSYNNTIPIFDSRKQIRKKIMRIVTDATDVDEPKDKDTPLFQLYSLFLDSSGQKDLSDRYEGTGLRYGDVKQELFEKVMDYFQPYREQRKTLISRPGQVHDILKSGAKKAKDVAEEVLDRVQAAVGVRYL